MSVDQTTMANEPQQQTQPQDANQQPANNQAAPPVVTEDQLFNNNGAQKAGKLQLQLINNVRVRTVNTAAGQSVRAMFELADGKTAWLTDKQITISTGLHSGFDVLKGSKLAVSFWKAGETMSTGVVCTKDDTIVQEWEFELSDMLTKMKTGAAFGMNIAI